MTFEKSQIRFMVTVIMVAATIAATTLYFQTSSAEINTTEITKEEKKIVYIDWDGYPTRQNMTNVATDIIVGRVDSLKSSTGIMLPVTQFDVEVVQALKGPLKKGDMITFQQFGGVNPEQSIVKDEVLLNTGDTYVLFLKYWPPTNTYHALGGPQGQFVVKDSKVYSMDTVDAQKGSSVSLREKDKPVGEYLNEVAQYVRIETQKASQNSNAPQTESGNQ